MIEDFIKRWSRMILSEQSESKYPNNWYVYIMQANTGRYYVGITIDVKKRLERHNSGQGSQFARQQGPFRLKYQCIYTNKSSARKREVQLKGWSRLKKEKLISGQFQ